MEAKELRIGNFLNGKQGHVIVTEIKTNNSVKIHDNTSVFSLGICLQPIQLTQEWLLKFGFFKHEGWFKKGNIVLHPVNNEYYRTGTHYGREMCTVKIEHVHQLQNLYFALTGEELTFKSE